MEINYECPICWEEVPFLVTYKCSHTICLACHNRFDVTCPLCKKDSVVKLPPLEECRKLIEGEDPRIFKPLRLYGLENVRYAFTDEVISLVSPKLPLRQLLYIRKICALSGDTGRCGFEIAHDLNDHEIRKGDSAIRFAHSRSSTRGSMSPLFQEVHAEATRRLARVNPAHRVRYAGVDLLRTTLVTTEGVRMNAIQYLVYCKWIVEGIPTDKLVEELPRRATLAAAKSLEESGGPLCPMSSIVFLVS